METFLAIIMVLGIFVAVPALIALAIVLTYATRAAKTRPEITVRPITKIKALKNNAVQISILTILCLYYPLIYYFGELIDHFGWEALRWDFFYTVHDIHRVVFLVPILFAAYFFKIKGTVITTIFALAVFLPRGLLLSPYPDPMSRMVVFIIFALGLGIFVAKLANKIEKLTKTQ